MTLCPYGSQPNPSAPVYKWATWIDAHAWLGAIFDVLSPLVIALQPVLHETAVFCATEPPQPVYPGDAVVAAAWTDRIAWEQCYQYLQDSATWWVWSNTCECLGAPGVTTHQGYDCAHSWNSSFFSTTNMELGNEFHTTVNSTLTTLRLTTWASFAHTYLLKLWESSSRTLIYSFNFNATTNGCADVVLPVPQALAAGTSYLVSYGIPPSYTAYEQTAGPDPGDTNLVFTGKRYKNALNAYPDVVAGGWQAIMPVVDIAASPTTPAGPVVPTTSIPALPAEACTTTADLCAQMARMLIAEQLTQRRVDLLQRRSLPFAWIAGSPLTGLTGAGSFTVQDCLGVIVDITTVPASWGSTTATPRRLQPAAGLIQGQLGSEWDDGRWVHYEHQVVLWDNAWATGVRYNFKPGIVATITPLYPEP